MYEQRDLDFLSLPCRLKVRRCMQVWEKYTCGYKITSIVNEMRFYIFARLGR